MTPTIQILPPVSARLREAVPAGDGMGRDGNPAQRSLGALVRMSPHGPEPLRTPMFNHAGAIGAPRVSIGFLAQHLAQEWTARADVLDPARIASAYRAGSQSADSGVKLTV